MDCQVASIWTVTLIHEGVVVHNISGSLKDPFEHLATNRTSEMVEAAALPLLAKTSPLERPFRKVYNSTPDIFICFEARSSVLNEAQLMILDLLCVHLLHCHPWSNSSVKIIGEDVLMTISSEVM